MIGRTALLWWRVRVAWRILRGKSFVGYDFVWTHAGSQTTAGWHVPKDDR